MTARGCICQGCDHEYRADLLVPDDIWEQIKPAGKPEGGGLLCPSCIMERIVERRIWTAGKAFDSAIHIRHLAPGALDEETLRAAAMAIHLIRTKNLGAAAGTAYADGHTVAVHRCAEAVNTLGRHALKQKGGGE